MYKLPADQPVRLLPSPASRSASRSDAIQHFAETTRNRLSAYTGSNIADFTTIQVHLAEAAATRRRGARRSCCGGCDEATRIVTEAGIVPSLEQRARYRRDGALCRDPLHQGGRRACSTATGGGAIYARNPIQRAFRDVHAANAHYMLTWDVNGAIYGRVALGLPPDAPL